MIFLYESYKYIRHISHTMILSFPESVDTRMGEAINHEKHCGGLPIRIYQFGIDSGICDAQQHRARWGFEKHSFGTKEDVIPFCWDYMSKTIKFIIYFTSQ